MAEPAAMAADYGTGARRRIPRFYLLYFGLLAGAAFIPLMDEPFYTRLATRIMIYGLCALSLDLILGYGGMVSFGHAAFLGMGAYTAAVMAHHGIDSAWIVWPAAIGVSAAGALVIGAVSLRTAGVYFIMITLAFAQMCFYFVSSLQEYGGDDGMSMWSRNDFGGVLDIADHTTFFHLVLAILFIALFLGRRLVNSRFGMVMQGVRENERRMRSLGFPVYRYKLACFVLSGAMAGLAGVLLANLTKYVSPALMHWTRSGDILIMVILGGMKSLLGPVLGAAALLLAEDFLSEYTRHWMIFLGPILIAAVLFARGGVYGVLRREKDA